MSNDDQRLKKSYFLPIDYHGQQRVMRIGEAMHRELEKVLTEQYKDVELKLFAKPLLTNLKKRPYHESSFIWDPYIPVHRPPVFKYDDTAVKGVMTRYAKQLVNPFYGNVTIGEMGAIASNPCAEMLIGDEDFYLDKLPDGDYKVSKRAPAAIADPAMYPHVCPRCTAPAYIGFAKVDCSRKSCG